MIQNEYLEIFHIELLKGSGSEILEIFQKVISEQGRLALCYANSNSLNLAYTNGEFRTQLSNFDIIHPDGIGVFLASKLLYGKNGFASRFTGSGFYLELIKHSLKNNWSFFFFGDTVETLKRITKTYPGLIIKGVCNGFNYNNELLIRDINNSNSDILIVGLGSPKQENWIYKNRHLLNFKVIIAVGDGIKVFAGLKKRGPKFLQKIGMEWLVRLIFEPRRLWGRYLVGNPIFLIRIFKLKFYKKNK